MQRIVPSLWFNNNAEEAMKYYCDVFPNSQITHIETYPDESLDPHFVGMSGKVIQGSFILDGVEFVCLDGGPEFTFSEAVSFTVACKDQSEIDYYWDKLSAHPDNEQCGWCKDKFGVSWQVIPENMGELLNSSAAMQCMMKQKKIVIDELKNAR